MRKKQICKIEAPVVDERLHVIDFVRDDEWKHKNGFGVIDAYRLFIVHDGRGKFVTVNSTLEVKKGSIFLAKPNQQFYVYGARRLYLTYFTFQGTRAPELVAPLKMRANGNIQAKLDPDALAALSHAQESISKNNAPLMMEAMLLYVLASLQFDKRRTRVKTSVECIQWIEQQVESRYSDPTITLTALAKEYGYDPKYVSRLYKRMRGKHFVEYLTSVRLENANRLIKHGFSSVKEISTLSGFGDPLYFSRIYKKQYGISPREAVERAAARKN